MISEVGIASILLNAVLCDHLLLFLVYICKMFVLIVESCSIFLFTEY